MASETPRQGRRRAAKPAEVAEIEEQTSETALTVGKGRATPGRRQQSGEDDAPRGFFGNLADYFQGVRSELNKVAWPTREQVVTLFRNVLIVTIIAAAALEASLKAVLESAQWRARVVETLFALAVGFGAIASLFEHQGMQLSLASGVSQLGLITLFMALGFFAYHTHRVLFVQGFAKTLVVHHVGMILCIAGGLIGDKAYYYILCACIPITSAAVRNFRWFYRKTHKTK